MPDLFIPNMAIVHKSIVYKIYRNRPIMFVERNVRLSVTVTTPCRCLVQVFARPLTVPTQTTVRGKPVQDPTATAEEDETDANVNVVGEQPFHSGSGTLLGVILPNATV